MTGNLNCPYCGSQQTVTRTSVKRRKGLSVGKIATGFLTLGNSVVLTGVSKKEDANQLSCSACGMLWHVT